MFGIVLVLLLASRAVFVFPILAAHNYWSKETLPLRHMIVAWCARMHRAHTALQHPGLGPFYPLLWCGHAHRSCSPAASRALKVPPVRLLPKQL